MTSLLTITTWTTAVLMIYFTIRNLIADRKAAFQPTHTAPTCTVVVVREQGKTVAKTERQRVRKAIRLKAVIIPESPVNADPEVIGEVTHEDAPAPEVAEIVEQHTEQIEQLQEEQAKQAALLARHEKRISLHDQRIMKIEAAIAQAEADIDHWKTQLNSLYAMLDLAQSELEAANVGGEKQSKYQLKVINLENKIHAAETKLVKAQAARAEAQRQLKEAA